MITRLAHGSVRWIDVVEPTKDEVRSLLEEFALDPLIADELTTPSQRNRVDTRDDYFYVVLHFPAFRHLHETAARPLELDFIVGRDWIITARYEHLDPLERFRSVFEMHATLAHTTMPHAGMAFHRMLADLYAILYDELEHIETRIDAAEERVFEGYERDMVVELSFISRDVLNYTQALEGHYPMLLSLEAPGVALYGYEYARNVRSLVGDYERLAAAVKSHRASLVELRETNDALLTTKQNETMKVLTIMAFVTFPLSLFTSLFGMGTRFTPIIGHAHDFWIIVGIMCAAALAFFAFFKYKRWL